MSESGGNGKQAMKNHFQEAQLCDLNTLGYVSH
jgi:hypothetical protein